VVIIIDKNKKRQINRNRKYCAKIQLTIFFRIDIINAGSMGNILYLT
jgi:hypothetical protein